MLQSQRSFGFSSLALAWVLTICGCDEGDGHVLLVANPGNALSVALSVRDDAEVTLDVRAEAPGAPTLRVRAQTASHEHQLDLLGMRAATDYTVEIRAFDASGALRWSERHPHRTDPLPEELDALRVRVPRPDAVSPGVTFFGVIRWSLDPAPPPGLIVGVDEQGEVVFLHRTDRSVQVVRQLRSGHLLYNMMPGTIVEIDLAGRVVRQLEASEIGTDSVHHELLELPSGNLVTLSSELRRIEGYDDGETSHDVVGDVIVELTPEGSVVAEHSVFDSIDPLRVRDGFDEPFWDQLYAAEAPNGTKDYTHGNAVVHDPADDSLIVSLRHQDWLVKLDRQSGELLWRFGPEGDFDLLEGSYAYHTHAPELQGDGSLLVYDNGNAREDLAEGELPYSRVVQYELDESAMTARQVWEYRGPEPYFAPFVGDADRLDNGNVLITDGGMVSDPALDILDPNNAKHARILEVTPEGEIVLEITLGDSDPAAGLGWTIYRAERRALFE